MKFVNRNDFQYPETNMDLHLVSLLKGKDPQTLTDIIELHDGTRIPSIILDINSHGVQYFNGKSRGREKMSSDNIYMLYIDEGTISIPFPVVTPDYAAL